MEKGIHDVSSLQVELVRDDADDVLGSEFVYELSEVDLEYIFLTG